MSLQGRVTIDMQRGGPPTVGFSLPADLSRLLTGKSADAAVSILPMVFSLCRNAQTHAAATALAHAGGGTVAGPVDLGRQALTEMESLREHLLRILIDWPRHCGDAPTPALAAPAMTFAARLETALFDGPAFKAQAQRRPAPDRALAILDEAEALVERLVFGMAAEDWLALRGRAALLRWAQGEETPAARFLAALFGNGDADCADLPVIALQPSGSLEMRAWLANGFDSSLPRQAPGAAGVGETSALTRHLNHPMIESLEHRGLLARQVARLVDLALIPARTRRLIGGKGSATKGGREDGKGWSRVRTARGDLLHAAALSDGKVLRYAIVQPTRWNFDGRGAAARCLADLAAAGTAVSRRRRAELLIDALDPCVAYDLRID